MNPRRRVAIIYQSRRELALTHLGLLIGIGGHIDQALGTIDRALARDPNYPPALLYRGQILYEAKKDTASAAQAWERFLTAVPPGAAAPSLTAC